MFRSFRHNRIHTRLSTVLLLFIMVVTLAAAPISSSLRVQKAEAISVTEIGPNLVQNTLGRIAGFLSAGSLTSLNTKEYVLDGIAYALAKKVIAQMTASLVQWINSGFQGSPAFISDLGGFLTGIADQVAGQVISDSGLGFVCSPFRLNVQVALQTQYQESKGMSPQCTLSGVVSNIQNFIGGSFGEGGWPGWFSMTTVPQNNPYGAMVLGQYKLNASIQNAQGQELKLLDYGNGFLSKKVCKTVNGQQSCTIVTPGSVIKDQLSNYLSSGLNSLISADEINEVISALLGQLANQAITGLNGLSGLSQDGGGGSGSYLDQLAAGTGPTIGLSTTDNNPIKHSIQIEGDMLAVYQHVVAIINGVEATLQTKQASGLCPGLTLTQPLQDGRTFSQGQIADITNTLSVLDQLDAEYASTTDPIAQAQILSSYSQLNSSGALHTDQDLAQLQIDQGLAQTHVDDFKTTINNQCI